MGLNFHNIQCVYQWKLLDFIILPELVQRLGLAGCNTSIMAMAIVFVESQYVLPIDSDLVGTDFINASKPIQLHNG